MFPLPPERRSQKIRAHLLVGTLNRDLLLVLPLPRLWLSPQVFFCAIALVVAVAIGTASPLFSGFAAQPTGGANQRCFSLISYLYLFPWSQHQKSPKEHRKKNVQGMYPHSRQGTKCCVERVYFYLQR